jgi:hypothetical protein
MEGRGDVLILSSNNYLGLCNEPTVVQAGVDALNRLGAGTASGLGVAALFAAMACGGAVLSGCAGLATSSNATPTPQEAVEISPSSISFAPVAPGQKTTQTATLTNDGTDSVTITQPASWLPDERLHKRARWGCRRISAASAWHRHPAGRLALFSASL